MARPQNVGIHALDMYFPKSFVSQTELETFSGVSAGKFTIGLGQDRLAFVNDREDVYSMALTVVHNLMEKYEISYNDIGRLEVGTETIMDHSKSVKSTLMQLFEESGNTNVEGIDSLHACYAGTAALFNSTAWVESSAWDGRYALVVVVDIAEYAQGPARPTGGAGAVAMLIGADAPLVVENEFRSSHFEHAYDFYKPNLSSPYPIVDGHYSNLCYLRSLDACYQRFVKKFEEQKGVQFDLDAADFVLFHAPYNKLVQKSFARLLYNDFVRFPERVEFAEAKASFGQLSVQESLESGALIKAFSKLGKQRYEDKVTCGTFAGKQLGNMYTASLYAGLVSLISSPEELDGRRVLLFSYGSGIASSMFSLRARSAKELQKMRRCIALHERMEARIEREPQEFAETLMERERLHTTPSFEPTGDVSDMFDNSFYLVRKDEKSRRFYERKARS